MNTNYGLTGRFAQKKRANWPQTTLAVASMVSASLFMAYVFAGAMR